MIYSHISKSPIVTCVKGVEQDEFVDEAVDQRDDET